MTRAMDLQPNDRPRLSMSIEPGFGRCSGISPEFARRFAEGIEKYTRNMSGDCRKKTIGLTVRMSKAVGLAGTGKPLVSDGCTTAAEAFGRLTCSD
ncbi:hypothetical protein GW17_00047139 [Ensete ventricosum]|nr:hypothetical protein GW17_00047139 [Ensete ventricosum]